MSLQVALIVLGLVILGLVLLFSYAREQINSLVGFVAGSKFGLLRSKLLARSKKRLSPRSIHREPSLVSANQFHLELDPDSELVGIEGSENSRTSFRSHHSSSKTEFEANLGQSLKIDYWARLPSSDTVICHDVLLVYRRHELDFEFPHQIHGRCYPSNVWMDLEEASSAEYFTDLVVSVQMVDPRGVITESELTRTNNFILDLADELNRKFQFDMTVEEALDRASQLDSFCQQHDLLVIINVAAREGSEFSGTDIQRIAERSRMQIGAMGMFHFLDSRTNHSRFTMANRIQPGSFEIDAMTKLSTRGLTLFMSVPRVSDPISVFDEMMSVAQYTASELSGELRDPDGGEIDEIGIKKIRQQVADISELFYRVGIVPGSEEALRLF